jgi:hypothetical protein
MADQTPDEKARHEAVAGTLADIIVLVSTLTRAHPQTQEAMTVLQSLIAQLMALTLGVSWHENNADLIETAIKERMEVLTQRVQAAAKDKPASPTPSPN